MARGDRSILAWFWLVLGLLALHDVTHLADAGLKTSAGELALVAVPQWIGLAVIAAIVVRGDRDRRRLGALVLGAGVLVGFVVVHLLPVAPAAYWDLEPSAISWALAWVPAAAGLVLAWLARPPVRRAGRAGAAA